MDNLCYNMGYRYSPIINVLGLSIMIHGDWSQGNSDDVLWSHRIRGYLTIYGSIS